MQNRRSSKKRLVPILAVVWLFGHLLALAYLFFGGIEVRGNILDLLLEKDRDERFLLGGLQLEKSSRFLHFLAEGRKSETVLQTLEKLRARLEKLDGLRLVELPDFSEVEEQFVSGLSYSRAYLLDAETRKQLSASEGLRFLGENISRSLSSPLAIDASRWLQHDPLLLLPKFLASQEMSSYGLAEGGFLLHRAEEESAASLFAELRESALDRKQQQRLVAEIERAVALSRAEVPEVQLRWSGIVRFSDSSAERLEADIKQVGTTASILVFFILLAAFHSMRPFLLSFLSAGSGVLAGVCFSQFFLGGLHLLTFAFGASLMGACVDYAIHYQCEQSFMKTAANRYVVLKQVFWPITIGALSAVLAFLVLLFTPFPGLLELSLFSISSLIASYISVILWFPFLSSQKFPDSTPRLIGWNERIFAVLRLYGVYVKVILAFGLVLSVYGLSILRSADDIRLLQAPLPNLVEDELWVRERAGREVPDAYVFVAATTELSLQERIGKVSLLLQEFQEQGLFERFQDISQLFPAPSEQELSFKVYSELIENQAEGIRELLTSLGFTEQLIGKALNLKGQRMLEASVFFQELGIPGLQELWLGNLQGKFWASIPVFSIEDLVQFRQMVNSMDSVTLYEPVNDISALFSEYRRQSMLLVSVAYVLIAVLFLLRYGASRGVKAFSPCLLSAVFCLGTLGLIGESLSFFSVLALVIVLGLCVDYSVFFAEDETEGRGVRLSVMLSTLSTVIPFGILSLSSTPVLRSFGLVIALGVLYAFLFSFIFAESKRNWNLGD